MQKKFLRTSILTLVIGLSLLTEIHAMDPDAEYQRPNDAKLVAHIVSYQRESNECRTKLHQIKLREDYEGSKIVGNHRHVGNASSLYHDREKSRHTGWMSSETGIHVPGCYACAILDSTVRAMVRDMMIYDARDFL